MIVISNNHNVNTDNDDNNSNDNSNSSKRRGVQRPGQGGPAAEVPEERGPGPSNESYRTASS